ncbi:unnamed protein product, partial [marine sediment metagenome]
DAASPYTKVFEALINIEGTWNNWYWFGASYRKSDGMRRFWAVNLDTGVESSTAGAVGDDESLTFLPSATSDGTQDSVTSWGTQVNGPPAPTFLWATWKGYLSQVYMHNKYIDFSDSANRRLFCATDGEIDYGVDGSIPLSEQPLVYLPSGHPSSNVGTTFIGTWDTDFFVNPATVSGLQPPTGTT